MQSFSTDAVGHGNCDTRYTNYLTHSIGAVEFFSSPKKTKGSQQLEDEVPDFHTKTHDQDNR